MGPFLVESVSHQTLLDVLGNILRRVSAERCVDLAVAPFVHERERLDLQVDMVLIVALVVCRDGDSRGGGTGP